MIVLLVFTSVYYVSFFAANAEQRVKNMWTKKK